MRNDTSAISTVSGKDFADSIHRLADSLDGIRRYTEAFRTHLEEESQSFISRYGMAAIPFFLLDFYRDVKDLPKNDQRCTEFDQMRNRAQSLMGPAMAIDYAKGAIRVVIDEPKLIETVKHVKKRKQEISAELRLLHEGALILAIAYVEVLASSLLSCDFHLYPNKLADQGSFTLKHLEQFSSVAEARQQLIDNSIDSTLRDQVNKWIETIKAAYNLRTAYLDNSTSTLREIFARRNVIVHNGGVANRRYISQLEGSPETLIGRRLNVGPDYLATALDRLEVSFVLLGAQCWDKAIRDDKEAIAELLNQIAYRALLASRWEVARTLSKFAASDESVSESTRIIARFNYWQACKWLDEFEDIRAEIELLDGNAYRDRFKLGWFALLDRQNEFFETLSAALASGEIAPWEANEWPIFRELRKLPRFQEVLSAVAAWEPVVTLDSEAVNDILKKARQREKETTTSEAGADEQLSIADDVGVKVESVGEVQTDSTTPNS